MSVLVVQSHPVPDSFNAALLGAVVGGMDRSGIEHRVHRLCQGQRPHEADLHGIDELVLVYPTWWGGQPATLLDWLQEMLAAEALGGISRLIAVTSLGSSRLLNGVQGEWGRSHLSGLVLAACAPDATFEWLALYKIDRQPQHVIDDHLVLVERRFAGEVDAVPQRPLWQRMPYARRPAEHA